MEIKLKGEALNLAAGNSKSNINIKAALVTRGSQR
jgi:hypothetical protein